MWGVRESNLRVCCNHAAPKKLLRIIPMGRSNKLNNYIEYQNMNKNRKGVGGRTPTIYKICRPILTPFLPRKQIIIYERNNMSLLRCCSFYRPFRDELCLVTFAKVMACCVSFRSAFALDVGVVRFIVMV